MHEVEYVIRIGYWTGEKLMPVLEQCSIKFYTTGAGKESDTKVNIAVRDDSDVIAAHASDFFGPFDEHSNHGPFDLGVLNASEKAGLRRGSVAVGYDPARDVPWKFNFFIFLFFSDGTRLSGGRVGVELNGECGERVFAIEEIVR